MLKPKSEKTFIFQLFRMNFLALFILGVSALQQQALNAIAAQIAADTQKSCVAPSISSGSTSGSCDETFMIALSGSNVISLFEFFIYLFPDSKTCF